MDMIMQDLREDLDQAFGDDSDTLYSDLVEGDKLNNELDRLLHATMAVERFGINPTAFGLLKTTNLLSGTALDVLAMENFSYDNPAGDESTMALEGLVDKIKTKAAEWSAKILSVVKATATKITIVLSGLYDKISEMTKTLTSKTWDKTKIAGRMIKAHPYKTVLAAVVAAGAVASIIALIATGMPGDYANENALQSFAYKVKDSITNVKWPLGQIVPNVVENANKITITINPGSVSSANATVSALGWTQSAVKALSGQLAQSWSSLKGGASMLTGKIANTAIKLNNVADPGVAAKEAIAKKTGSNISGWVGQQLTNKAAAALLWGLVGVIATLLKEVVVKAFRMVYDTFRSLRKEVEPQAA